MFSNKNLDVQLGGKGGQKGKKVHKFHFRLEIHLHYYFHANWALLEDFEIFTHFDHLFTLLFRTFRPLEVGMTPLGQKFELQMQVLDPLATAEQETTGLASPLGSINGF